MMLWGKMLWGKRAFQHRFAEVLGTLEQSKDFVRRVNVENAALRAEVERLRAALACWDAKRNRIIVELEEGLQQIVDGDVPWADGMVRAGFKDAHDLQAFARSLLEDAE